MELQVGANSGDVRLITLPDTRPVTLGIVAENFTISGAAGAEVWTSDVSGVSATTAGTAGTTATGHINLQTQDNSQAALGVIDAAIDTLNNGRANAGAYQNRLENVISGLDVFTNNSMTSRSRIQDADFAKETADLAKNQILAQAGMAMLSQANQIPQNVLSLIK
jgi:flagellin